MPFVGSASNDFHPMPEQPTERRVGTAARVGRKLYRLVGDLLVRTPVFLPLVVVVGVILGGAGGWLMIGLALVIATLLRMFRILICSVLCGAVIGLNALLHERHEQSLLAGDVVRMSGQVIGFFGSSYVVESSWPGVRVLLKDPSHTWRRGDRLSIEAVKQEIPEPPVPGMFSSSSWMRGRGISVRLIAVRTTSLHSAGFLGSTMRLSDSMRSFLADRLMPPCTQTDARRQVLCALTLGEKDRADPSTMETFRRGGCLHAFAVSGLHVGIVAAILWLLLRLCRVRPALGRYIILIAVGVYVFATGMAPPAVRAYVMLAVLMGGLMLRRRVGLFNTWCLAALVILVVQPWQLFQAGFQLSFVVYGAICIGVRYGLNNRPWFGPDDYLPPRIHTKAERMAVRADLAVRGAVLVSLCAWLVSLPIVMSQFHVVNTGSYLTNIAITPVVPLVMLFGLLVIAFGAVPFLGPAFHFLATRSAGFLLALVGFSGSIPGAYLPAHPPADPSSFMAVSLQRQKSFCVLGNPGVLIGDLNNEADARYCAEPALFHSGLSPAFAWGARSEASRAVLLRSWPSLRLMDSSLQDTVRRVTTPAGSYVFYPPVPGLPAHPVGNSQPIILWQRADGVRFMFVGNAAAPTLDSLPPDECRADVLILGYNTYAPITGVDTLLSMGVKRLILLPGASKWSVEQSDLPPGISLLRLSPENNPFFFESVRVPSQH